MAEEREKLEKENDEPEVEDNDVEAHSWGGRDKLGDDDRDKYGEEGERGKLT